MYNAAGVHHIFTDVYPERRGQYVWLVGFQGGGVVGHCHLCIRPLKLLGPARNLQVSVTLLHSRSEPGGTLMMHHRADSDVPRLLLSRFGSSSLLCFVPVLHPALQVVHVASKVEAVTIPCLPTGRISVGRTSPQGAGKPWFRDRAGLRSDDVSSPRGPGRAR